jgi:starch-binding outer membrane protein, SusD/RagB family
MFRKVKYMVVVGAVAAGLTGCADLLDTEPRQSVSPEVALENVAGIQAIVTSGYSRLQAQNAYGQRLQLVPDVLADNTVRGPGGGSGRLQSEHQNVINTGVGNQGFYQVMYALVNEMNYVIEGAPTTDAPEATRRLLEGEARFLRALAYHNLAKVYGYEPGREVGGWNHGVILRTEAVRGLTGADLRERAPVSEVYTLVKTDLEAAIPLLAGQTNRIRATPGAAQALLARVHLFASEWAQAETRATAALAATGATLQTTAATVETIFQQAVNPESVFQVSVRPTESLGRNESLAALTQPNSAAGFPGLGWQDVLPSPEVLALFEEGDFRNAWFYTHGGARYSLKYSGWRDTPARSAHTDNIPVIRVPEVLLIRAEARAEQGGAKVAEGLADLNTLRAARGASQLEGLTAAQLIAAIQDERRRELHLEGHRFFDLKRRGQEITKAAASQGSTVLYTDPRILMPLPTRELDLNPNLRQNPGY